MSQAIIYMSSKTYKLIPTFAWMCCVLLCFNTQAWVDESAYGSLSREDMLTNWLEHCAASEFVIDDCHSIQPESRADSVLEVLLRSSDNR